MTDRRAFAPISSIEELNRVNDAQKALFDQISANDPTLPERRVDAYLHRWREALVYVKPGSRVLDIGGGWLPEPVWSLLLDEYKLDYHSVDIDPEVTQAAADRLRRAGRPPENAIASSNTVIPHREDWFDFIFSSHCLEHSPDLVATFAEIHRVLRTNGSLFFAVPFGFDLSDEHLLFLEAEDWLTATELGGFEIINSHLGKTYGLTSWDLSIIAQPRPGKAEFERLVPFVRSHSKAGLLIAPFDDAIFSHQPGAVWRQDCVVHQGIGAGYTVAEASGRQTLLHVRHPWSGIVRISNGGTESVVDLYSRYHHIGATDITHLPGPLTIDIVGKNQNALASELVFIGALLAGS